MFLKILNLRRFSALWLLIATIALGIIPQNQSYAQIDPFCGVDSEWSYLMNFRTSDHAQYLLTNETLGQWVSGTGYSAAWYPGGGGGAYDELWTKIVFSNWSITLDTVLFTYSYQRGGGAYSTAPRVFVGAVPLAAEQTTQGDNLQYLVAYGSSLNMTFRARPNTYISSSPTGKMDIHSALICGHGDNPFDTDPEEITGFDRPILAEDSHNLQYWSNSWDDGSVPEGWCDIMTFPLVVPNCIEAMNLDLLPETNNKRGRVSYNALPNLYTFPSVGEGDVYSIGEGTVIEVMPLTESQCAVYLLGNESTECAFEVPPYASGESLAELYKVAETELYLVQVLTGDDYLITYILKEPTVEAGDSVGVNCVLGRIPRATLRPYGAFNPISYSLTPQMLSPSAIGTRPVSFDQVGGAVFVGVDFLDADLPNGYPKFDDHEMLPVSWGGYPDAGLSCKVDPAFSGCVSVNPTFENGGQYWQNVSVTNPVEWREPGVIIPPGGGVRLPDLVLDNVEYGLSFRAKTFAGTSPLSVSLGTDEWSETVSYTSTGFDRAPALITPDDGMFTTIEFRNEGQNDIFLEYACLHAENVRQGVSSCLLNNYSFAMANMSWNITAGSPVFATTQSSDPDLINTVQMPRDSVITQTISIYPNEDGSPHVYQIQIYGRRLAAGAGIRVEIAGTTIFNQTFSTGGYQTLTANFTISTAQENAVLKVTSLGDSSDDSVEIAKICIPGPHPGFGDGGTPDPEGCQVIPTPTNTTVSNWIQWQWNRTRQYWDCTLMPLLSQWYGDFRQMVKDFTDIGFFLMQTMHRGADWLGTQFLPWLAGYLSNISPGTILVNQNNGECAPWDIACYVTQLLTPIVGPIAQFIADILGLFVQLLSFVLSLLGALISLVFGVFNQFVELIGVSFQYVIGIGDAYVNAVPEPIDGLPACLTPDENFICTGYWILENTILGGVGAFYVPLITGLGYILLFISLFKRARGLVIKSADRI